LSLDILVGWEEKNIYLREYEVQFEELYHDLIFSKKYETNLSKLKQFSKMNDYYDDCFYSEKDIIELRKELLTLKGYFKSTEIVMFFNSFLNLCDVALKRKMNIYCVCD